MLRNLSIVAKIDITSETNIVPEVEIVIPLISCLSKGEPESNTKMIKKTMQTITVAQFTKTKLVGNNQ
ncbi:hypothetical protein [Candidatus Izimaplasma sp. HR1]|jgi:hypothetical protein|uniref:hypothetical protein n=1 Tax=Candidatus Izimoplasma sp. HR1 TaxID=1541959 RepID=UPI00056EB6FD